MKVAVDDDTCAGHGVCCTLCPEVFTLNDDGFAVVTAPDVPAELEEAVATAARRCPSHAITLS